MASNKAATAILIAAFAMIFAVEVAVAQDMRKLLHFLDFPRDAIRNSHAGLLIDHQFLHRRHTKPPSVDSVPHYIAAEKPAVSSASTAAETPAVSSAGTAAETPAVSSAGTAAEAPAVSPTNTEETNFVNPYS